MSVEKIEEENLREINFVEVKVKQEIEIKEEILDLNEGHSSHKCGTERLTQDPLVKKEMGNSNEKMLLCEHSANFSKDGGSSSGLHQEPKCMENEKTETTSMYHSCKCNILTTCLDSKGNKCSCSFVEESFDTDQTLHQNVKKFKCSKCNYVTNHIGDFRAHMLNHKGIKLFRCSRCDYGTNLKKHIKIHELKHLKVKIFKCSRCDYGTTTTPKPTKGGKKPVLKPRGKYKSLNISQKLEILDKMDADVKVKEIMEDYGISHTTFYDIRRAKDKLRAYRQKHEDPKLMTEKRKRVTGSKYEDLDNAVWKWYKQERSVRISIRGIDLQSAADRFAKKLGIPEFTASSDWLFRFRHRHSISNKKIVSETLTADKESVEPFREQLKNIISDANLMPYQVYNADETGIAYALMPNNTQAMKLDKVPGRKGSKARVSILLCANADGSHRLVPMVVGKSKKPRSIKNIMKSLPVIYDATKSAWFTRDLFYYWFHHHFVPAVRKFLEEKMMIPIEDVKALLLIDNAPAHPNEEELCSRDGKIKCIFLPPNTTSLIQPVDQCVIEMMKRNYRRKQMEDCFVVLESREDEVEDTRGQRTLENMKKYNMRNVVFNIAAAWNAVPNTTLYKGWNKLLRDIDFRPDFEGIELEDFIRSLLNAGERMVTKDDVIEWLEYDEDDPDHHFVSEDEIVSEVQRQEKRAADDDDNDNEEESGEVKKVPKLSEIRYKIEDVMEWMELTDNSDFSNKWYDTINQLRTEIVAMQYKRYQQTKVTDFFKPLKPASKRQRSSDTGYVPSSPESSDVSILLGKPSPGPSREPSLPTESDGPMSDVSIDPHAACDN